MYEVGGVSYNSIEDACAKLNLDVQTVSDRLLLGWSKEVAFELVKPKGNKPISNLVYGKDNAHKKKIVYNGVEYTSYPSLAKALGVEPKKLTNRIYKGMTIDEALADIQAVTHVRSNGVEYRGKKYNTLRTACKDNNVPYEKMTRMLTAGYTIEQIIDSHRGTVVKEDVVGV